MSELIRSILRARHVPRPAMHGGEREFFADTGVPGYAADDNQVVMNPSLEDPNTYKSVWANEAARIEMRKNGDFFTFPMQPHQASRFREWGADAYMADPQAARQTTVARILAGDQSLAPYTPQQFAAAQGAAGRMIASAPSEQRFQEWYSQMASDQGLDPNPDAPEHHYDYRGAFIAGMGPGSDQHWPSTFKRPGHPNRYVDGIDTITGKPAP